MEEFDAICDEAGWDSDEIVSILLEYIDNQCDDATFVDYLLTVKDAG